MAVGRPWGSFAARTGVLDRSRATDFSQIQDKLYALGGVAAVAAVIVVVAILVVLPMGFVMWIAASLAGVERATFLRSILAAVTSAIFSSIGSAVGSAVPACGPGMGLVLGVVGAVFAIKMAYKTTFWRAVLVWLCAVLVVAGVLLILTLLRGGGVSVPGVAP